MVVLDGWDDVRQGGSGSAAFLLLEKVAAGAGIEADNGNGED